MAGRLKIEPAGLPLPLLFLVAPLLQVHVDGEQKDADADGGVRHVEGGPVVVVPVGVEEVDHLAEPYPVDEVAERPGEDESEGEGAGVLVA